MQIAQVIGGYTLGGADLLRRAMGKKNQEEMDAQRGIFVAGAEKNALSKGRATQLFDLMQKFAGYGFNKSHAAAYALLAYQTAYMKTHHAAAFMAANFSAVMDDTDKVRALFEDSVANGLTVLPPDVNTSVFRFEPVDGKTVRYGLGAIRGSGESAVASIVEARKDGPFLDLFDFCRRLDKRVVNRRTVEALVRAGAFDGIDRNRAALLASVGRAMDAAEQHERAASQVSLFGDVEATPGDGLGLVETRAWDLRQTLTEEKVALGYCLSGHLFSVYAPALEGFPRVPLARLAAGDHRVWLAGVVSSARVQMTRRGRMMVVLLDDGTAQLEVTVFSELFDAHRDKLKEDAPLVVQGKAQVDHFSGGLRVTAEDLLDLDALRARYATRLRLAVNGTADARRLHDLLEPFRADGKAGCPVVIHYENAGAACDVALGDGWRVHPAGPLIERLAEWLAPENVRVVYATES